MTRAEMRRIVTAFALPVLFYVLELWFELSSFRSKARIRSVYYSIIRLMLKRGHWTSRLTLDKLSKRANCDQWCEFSTAKMFANIYTLKSPVGLYQCVRNNSYYKTRFHGRVFMFSTAASKIGQQSISNRLRDISFKLDFNWLFLNCKDKLRVCLKKIFFPYISSSFPPA